MYILKNLDWLPKPHTLEFVKNKLFGYKYTSAIVFVVKNNKILLVNVKSRGWDFVGGRVEKNEKIKDCAKREFLEETGFLATSLKFIGSHKIDCKSNPKGKHTAQAIYLGKLGLKLSDKLEEDILEARWFEEEELQSLNLDEWKMKLINYIYSII